ncbi:serine O-acetyltransferase [Marseilla massiliensis]|jgi:serine O-acetyltransferase|uniref:Serine acetyltransferase n=1 Tax=Marseilla massiliensis TaxID=1841864 RepID=A0A938WQS9_9BACT|nr:serine acetyltransferase [Marseilla massiliensis]MBM6672404.1 serine acetyltransferase [Marseilla massiliensis]
MSTDNLTQILTGTIDRLSRQESLKELFHQHRDGDPLPSGRALKEIIELARSILFPGFFGNSTINTRTLKYHIGVDIERMHKLLTDQILAGLCFMDNECPQADCPPLYRRPQAEEIAARLIERMPYIRDILATDVEAAYNGDPAAESRSEIIACYPVIRALVNYRLAHELVLLGVPLIPRIITEMAHSETGIDIHPAAQIGHHFTIDHGTGVVIGATCIIGNNVKLYQGVTLGAKSFPLDDNGNPIKGIPRHPILEDDVIVYSNATILGRITIGKGCVVGANIWVTEDMEPMTKKVKRNVKE